MYLQYAFSLAAGGLGTEAIFWIALALCACLIGVEGFGIYVLIKKLLPVFKGTVRDEDEEDSTNPLSGAILMFGAVPMPLQVTLLVFMIVAAVGAAVLVALLVLLRVNGYEMAFDEMPVDEDEEEEEAQEEVAEEPVEAETEKAIPAFAETPEVIPVTVEPTASSAMIPVYSSARPEGQTVYVEKHFKETYREVIRETVSPGNEAILRAIEELMKVSIQLRTEREMAVGAMAAAAASVPEPEEDVDDVESDEIVEDDSDADASEDSEAQSDLFSANERIVGFDEDTGCYIVAHYRKSLEAKLIQARPEVKKYFSEIKNALLAYEGTTDRMSWTLDTFVNEKTPVARINVRTSALDLYLALDPTTLEDSVYRGRDVGDKKKYADTPFLFRVNSARKLTLALELVQRTAEELGLAPIDIEQTNYEEVYPFEATDSLVERGLIREYLREEKPSVSFEPAVDTEEASTEETPTVEETKTAAFSTWELDTGDDESTAVIAADTTADVSADEAPVTRETVITTERTYTESYYGDPSQAVRTATERTTVAKNPIEIITATEEEAVEEILPEEETVEEETVEEETVEEETVEEETVEEETVEEETVEEGIFEEETAEAETAKEEAFEEDIWKGFEGVIQDIFYEPSEPEANDSEEEEVFGTFDIVDGKEILTKPRAPRQKKEPVVILEEEETEEKAVTAANVTYGTFDPDEEFDTEEDEVPWVEDEDEVEKEIEEEAEEEIEKEIEEETEEETEEEIEEEAEEETEEEAEEEIEEEIEEEAEEAPVVVPRAMKSDDPTVALIDVCTFDEHFESGALITLDVLKSVGLVDKQVTKLKLFASGELKGKFTVEANHFTLDAIMAISAADGDSVMIR